MKSSTLTFVVFLILNSGCKKKICGTINAISTEVSPANGQPIYTFYLQTGEEVRSNSRGAYQVGQAYCND